MSQEFCDDYVGIGAAEQGSSLALKVSSLALLGITSGVVLVSYLYFFVHYKKYAYTKARNIYLLSCFAVGMIVVNFNYCLQGYIGSINFSCRAFSLLTGFQVVLVLQSSWIRLLSLFWRIDYNRLLIKQTYLAFTKGDLKQKPGSIRFVQLRTSKNNRKTSYYADVLENEGTAGFFEGKNPEIQNYFYYQFRLLKEKALAILLFDVLCIRTAKKYPINIRIAGVFASPRFASSLYSVLLVCSGITLLSVEFHYLPLGSDCFNCISTPTIICAQVMIGFSALFVIYALVRLYKVYDSFGIRKELLGLGIGYIIVLGGVYIVKYALKDIEEDGQFNFFVLLVIYIGFVSVYVFPYQIWLARKIAKRNVVVEEDEDLLKTLVESEEGRKAFALFLACSLCLENLFFYDAATKWKNEYSSIEANMQQTTAEEIYAQFLAEGALLAINVSDGVKQRVVEKLVSGLNESTFDEAIRTVWDHMASDIFPRFKKTAYFKASRNELQDV